MLKQVGGVLRAASGLQVLRRGRGGHALNARANRNGDHVLLKTLVIADAGIEGLALGEQPRNAAIEAAVAQIDTLA
ncbi:hypothetical protein PS3A_35160 [Pseudomonas sp. 3A(2025)]